MLNTTLVLLVIHINWLLFKGNILNKGKSYYA
jgi:hypothetical protein